MGYTNKMKGLGLRVALSFSENKQIWAIKITVAGKLKLNSVFEMANWLLPVAWAGGAMLPPT